MYVGDDWTREKKEVTTEEYRSQVRRDSARVLHSPAFRRLQGKMQLFPGKESDFFRNRLTHSLEVGQIAKSIAIGLNAKSEFLEERPVDPDLVELAGWCHDLGHPPFGHTGEYALDRVMKEHGGFEGNAQTLRILMKLEKKVLRDGGKNDGRDENGNDRRIGLNLTYRTLASVLKYDNEIPRTRAADEPLQKGYYAADADVVGRVKAVVSRGVTNGDGFRTVECDIMDVADDIAYSTYDLEDALKTGFLTPMGIISARSDVLAAVASRCSRALDEDIGVEVVEATIRDVFGMLVPDDGEDPYRTVMVANMMSKTMAENGYVRTRFTSGLVGSFIRGVELVPCEDNPALSRVELVREKRLMVEVLKHFTYESIIRSPDLRIVSERGARIVRELYGLLVDTNSKAHELLPLDIRAFCEKAKGTDEHKRAVCDFIAGMTDSYCVEYYCRLKGEDPGSIFKRV